MKRGVWIVELRYSWSDMFSPVMGESYRFRGMAAGRCVALRKMHPQHRYRAVRYVPAAELTRKPRKRKAKR